LAVHRVQDYSTIKIPFHIILNPAVLSISDGYLHDEAAVCSYSLHRCSVTGPHEPRRLFGMELRVNTAH
jgi:hypothetical protein